jgi:hypothetical protein
MMSLAKLSESIVIFTYPESCAQIRLTFKKMTKNNPKNFMLIPRSNKLN